jgi:hypothetical protein
MERLRWIVTVVDGVAALVFATLGFLWAIGSLPVGFVDPTTIKASAWSQWSGWHWLVLLGSIWLILVNVVVVGARWFSSKYDTHLRCRTPDGEISITVYALEETLMRLVKTLPEIADISVTVRKEKLFPERPVRIIATATAYEGISLKEITERVRELILRRYLEIIESHVKPQVEFCVYKLIERPQRKEAAAKKTRKDVPSEQIFRGPVYPVDAES